MNPPRESQFYASLGMDAWRIGVGWKNKLGRCRPKYEKIKSVDLPITETSLFILINHAIFSL